VAHDNDREQPDVSRRDLGTLLGILGGAAGLAAIQAACSSDGVAQDEPLARTSAPLGSGANVFAIAQTVLGSPLRSGDLATKTNTTLVSGQATSVVAVEACSNSGDGGGGLFYWSTSNITDDGGTFIVPAAGGDGGVKSVGPGWVRIYSGPLNVRWFGARGNSSHDDTSAINAAIAVANELPAPNNVSQSIYFPTGFYLVTSALTPVTANNVTFLGDGSDSSVLYCPTGTCFQFGTASYAIVGGAVRALGFSYLGSTPTSATILFRIFNATDLEFVDIRVQSAGVIASIGNDGYRCAGAVFQRLRGYVYYSGSGTTPAFGAFQLGYGEGFIGSEIALAVGGGAPTGDDGGIPSPAIPSVNSGNYGTLQMTGSGSGMVPANSTSTTPGGLNFMQIIPPAGQHWDTVYLTNVLAQQFTAGVFMYSHSGAAIEFITIDNCVFDNCGQTGFSAEIDAHMSNISVIKLSNSIFTGWDSFGVLLAEAAQGVTYLSALSITDCLTRDTGGEGIFLGAQTRNVVVSDCNICSPNRLTSGTANGIRVYGGATDFTISNCTIGKNASSTSIMPHTGISIDPNCSNFTVSGNDVAGISYGILVNSSCSNFTLAGNVSTASGTGTPSAIYIGVSCTGFTITGNNATASGSGGTGFTMLSSCDKFSVTGNSFAGASSNTYLSTDSLCSPHRVLANNGGADYAGYQTGAAWPNPPAPGVAWQNFTAFRVEVYVYSTGNASISSLQKNGHQVTAGPGSVILNPGDSYKANYTINSGTVVTQYFVDA
jgi:hypothetical protein